MDPESELLTIGPLMMISQRDHDIILSDHIHLHRIKHESDSCWFELDKIENGNDAPPHTDWTPIRVNDFWKLKVFIPVETHIIIG